LGFEMKKFLPVVIIVVALAAGAAVYWNSNKSDHSSDNDRQAYSSESKYRFKKACDILTEADAKQLLGSDITGGTTSVNAATADIDVSTCVYTQQFPPNTPISSVKEALSAKLLVRAAKSDTGALSNASQFGERKPADAQDVSGYGDKAFWWPGVGELHILKRSNQYILSYGKASPADRTLEQAKKMADLLIDKL
jgi:hypothetical protein